MCMLDKERKSQAFAFQTAIRLPPVGLFAPSEGVELSDKEKIVWEKAKLMCEEEQKT